MDPAKTPPTNADEPSTDNSQGNQQTEEKPAESNHIRNHARSPTLWMFTLFLLIVGGAWLAYWFFYLQYHQHTDDAYANGNKVSINSAVTGTVIAFYADNTDLVEEGQLIIRLDPTDYRMKYEKELASLANTTLQVRQLYDNILVSIANRESKKALLDKAQFDYDNRKQLIQTHAVTNEDFIHSKDDLLVAQLALKQAEYQLQMSIDAVGEVTPDKHPMIEQQKGNVRTAFYDLTHCSIYAPTTGYVAQRAVNVGETVSTLRNLMAIIPIDYVWVDANFKETQLTYMRIGQPATVWFDLYGSSVKYEGKVLGIASGSGSVFSLIPPQNATGNWIKIVQRLPVRISLDPKTVKDYPTRLGISAEVDVDITNQDLPMLAPIPSTKLVDSTKVFEIDLKEVEALMDDIVLRNLGLKKD
jgi:membrane fusion protein (multidrug efflux system)